MLKRILSFLLILVINLAHTQESLLLGELKAEDIYMTPRTDGAIKVATYIFKYSKKGIYTDSTITGFEQFGEDGLIKSKVNFTGKKRQNSNSFTYEFEGENMIRFSYLSISEDGNYGRQGEFSYDGEDFLIHQKHSLANIRYEYHSDGRMKTKSYFYDNKGEAETEPWVNYFFYDDSLNLIHVDPDPNSTAQTSFYNDKNELIKHDYYPGVAYSTYAYDITGNCTKQVDYEMDNKGWDSIVYIFTYDQANKLVSSGQQDKKGNVFLDEKRIYLENDELKEIIYYRKNKPRFVKRFNYQFDEE